MRASQDKNNARRSESKPRRVPGLPAHVQQFGLCILFHLLLPFLPFGVEAAVSKGHVDRRTLLLFFAIYPLTIGVSSRSALLFGGTIVIGLTYSIAFGLVSGNVVVADVIYTLAYFCVGVVVLVECCERFNRHVAEKERFWQFA